MECGDGGHKVASWRPRTAYRMGRLSSVKPRSAPIVSRAGRLGGCGARRGWQSPLSPLWPPVRKANRPELPAKTLLTPARLSVKRVSASTLRPSYYRHHASQQPLTSRITHGDGGPRCRDVFSCCEPSIDRHALPPGSARFSARFQRSTPTDN